MLIGILVVVVYALIGVSIYYSCERWICDDLRAGTETIAIFWVVALPLAVVIWLILRGLAALHPSMLLVHQAAQAGRARDIAKKAAKRADDELRKSAKADGKLTLTEDARGRISFTGN